MWPFVLPKIEWQLPISGSKKGSWWGGTTRGIKKLRSIESEVVSEFSLGGNRFPVLDEFIEKLDFFSLGKCLSFTITQAIFWYHLCLCFLHFLEYRWSNSELVFWFYWCSRGKWEKCQKQCFHYYHHLTQIQKKMSGKVFFADVVTQAPCGGPAIHWIKTRIKCFNVRSETQSINMQERHERHYFFLYIILLVLSDRPWSQNHL